jgi:hypothetical protein
VKSRAASVAVIAAALAATTPASAEYEGPHRRPCRKPHGPGRSSQDVAEARRKGKAQKDARKRQRGSR